jgi:allantoicase
MAHFTEALDLAAERVGGEVLEANDEFFAEKENLLKAGPAVFEAHRYTDRGKWMDGWETRRRREPGHDWCVVRLGLPGAIRGFDVDTSFFRGNYPDACSIDACAAGAAAGESAGAGASGGAGAPGSEAAPWVEILPRAPLLGDAHNYFAVADARRWTHVRLHIYPDGGVARLRVHGTVVPDWSRVAAGDGLVDLAAVANGGVTLLSSDMFFGSHVNLLMPGRAASMADGWETKRRRGPGHDWVILRLGARGAIRRVEVDTSHFKGNFPDRCALETCDAPADVTLEELTDARRTAWTPLLGESKLRAHAQHVFEAELAAAAAAAAPATHVRFHIYPDGGVSRLRLWGRPADAGTSGR